MQKICKCFLVISNIAMDKEEITELIQSLDPKALIDNTIMTDVITGDAFIVNTFMSELELSAIQGIEEIQEIIRPEWFITDIDSMEIKEIKEAGEEGSWVEVSEEEAKEYFKSKEKEMEDDKKYLKDMGIKPRDMLSDEDEEGEQV